MKRRVISLLIALMMLVTSAAAAETAVDSTMYSLVLYNPSVYMNDEVVLDMYGLELDLSAAVTDSGEHSVMLELFAGEEGEYLTGAYAQLDKNGLCFYLDGMADSYTIDLKQYLGGMDVYTISAMLPVRSMLKELDFSDMDMEIDLSAPVRFAAVEEAIAGIAHDTLTTDSATEYRFSVSREMGDAIMAEMVKEALAQGQDIEAMDEASFELTGTLVCMPTTQTISVEGNLIHTPSEEKLPFTISYLDAGATITASLTCDYPGGEEMFSLSASVVTVEGADGRTSVTGVMGANVDGESAMNMTYSATPVEGSEQMDYCLDILEPDDQNGFSFYLSTNTYAEGEGFYTQATVIEDGEESSVYALYQGDVLYDESVGNYRDGVFQCGYFDAAQSYDFVTGVLLLAQDVERAYWMFNSDGSINLETMTENELNAAMMGIMGVVGEAMPKLQAGVPGLAPYLDSAMSSMMG